MGSAKLRELKLKGLVADEAVKLVQTECGIGLMGTPTEKSETSGGGRQQHRVRLYELCAGKLKSVGQYNDMFMGLRRAGAVDEGAGAVDEGAGFIDDEPDPI